MQPIKVKPEIKTILLISEKEWLVNEISHPLRNSGHKIIEAKDYGSALEILKIHKVYSVLTDFKMPIGDDLDFISNVRQIDSRIPIIFFSGYVIDGFSLADLKFCTINYFDGDKNSILVKSAIDGIINSQKPALRGILERMGLNSRQITILENISAGECNKTIAHILNLSEQGVKYHVGILLKEFKVQNRKELQKKLFNLISVKQIPTTLTND